VADALAGVASDVSVATDSVGMLQGSVVKQTILVGRSTTCEWRC
jgi:hypothetical protein